MIERIVIVGAGVAGAATAAALTRALPRGAQSVTIVPIDDPDNDGIGAFGPAETALPDGGEIQALLGLDEEALLEGAGASFSLGSAWTGWADPQQSHFLPFGDTGAPIGSVAFHQLIARARAEGGAHRLANYSVAAIAAQLGRFARPVADRRSILSSYSYGLHVDRRAYAELLLREAARNGAVCAEGRFARAELAADGDIAAIVLDTGERIAGDLFVDCSGASALLIEGVLGAGFESWRRWLPCDRAVDLGGVPATEPPPYFHVSAHVAGWRRAVPLADRIGECFVYSSEHLRDDLPQGEVIRFESGRRAHAWVRNCVAIGASAGMIEPIAASGLQTLHTGVARLIALFPSARGECAEAAEYNRLTAAELDRLRDFAILKYKLNGREGEPFWDALRDAEVPDELAYKIELYRSRGRLALLDEETFEEPDWVAVFDAHGEWPRRYDPLADAIPAAQLDAHLERLKQMVLNAAAGLPAHGDYLRAQSPTRTGTNG